MPCRLAVCTRAALVSLAATLLFGCTLPATAPRPGPGESVSRTVAGWNDAALQDVLAYARAQKTTGLHRRAALCGLAALPLVACGFGAPAWVGLLAMAVAVLGARCGWALRLAGLAAWAAMTWAAIADESAFVLAFVHLHNAMALALWWALRPRDRRALVVVALVLAGVALLLVGALDRVVAAAGRCRSSSSMSATRRKPCPIRST